MLEAPTEPKHESQTAKILRLLKSQGKLTNVDLNNRYHIFRYSARIRDLRGEGHIIVSNHVKDSLWEFIYKGEREGGGER